MESKIESLENEMILLRALEPEDVDILYKWENDVSIWKMSNTIAPFSKYILRQFIENQRYDIYETRQLRLIIEFKKTGTPLGCIDLFDIDPHNRRAGVGILIYQPQDKGQGHASAALALLIRYCFQVLNFNQLYCNITSNNTHSISLFKSKGFTTIGLKKEWIKTTSGWQDEYMLQLVNVLKT